MKNINLVSPSIRDGLLVQGIGKYNQIKDRLIYPIGASVEVYTNTKTEFNSDNGILGYTEESLPIKNTGFLGSQLSLPYLEYRPKDDGYEVYGRYEKPTYHSANVYYEKNSIGNIVSKSINLITALSSGGSISYDSNGIDFQSNKMELETDILNSAIEASSDVLSGKPSLASKGIVSSIITTSNNFIANEYRERELSSFLNNGKIDIFGSNIWIERIKGKLKLPDWMKNIGHNFISVYDYSEINSHGGSYSKPSNYDREPNDRVTSVKTWSDYNNDNAHKDSILTKTKMMFASGRLNSLITGGTYTTKISGDNSVSENNPMTKGSGVILNDEAYRSWSESKKYGDIYTLIRPFNADKEKKVEAVLKSTQPNREKLKKNGVLDYTNGFVKIAPYKSDNNDIKKYMFSIENLAWKDSVDDMIKGSSQDGPNGGRIMWFPPYDITFNENTSVSINSDVFIGRGEPVYTYTNTERNGTISFKIVVDHSSVLNYYNKNAVSQSDYINFNAGGSVVDVRVMQSKPNEEAQTTTTKANPTQKTKKEFKIFFPNNYDGHNDDDVFLKLYSGLYEGKGYEMSSDNDPDNMYSLNSNSLTNDFSFKDVYDSISGKNGDFYSLFTGATNINIIGVASSHGNSDSNKTLSKNRAESVKKALLKLNDRGIYETASKIDNVTGTDVNTIDAKKARYVLVKFEVPNTAKNNSTSNSGNNKEKETTKSQDDKTTVTNLYMYGFRNDNGTDNEEKSFFESIGKSSISDIISGELKKRIKYFHPAFHSMTPEGFNSRLTFLHQCTRQGPTMNKVTSTNMAFGRPPICVLRIGDFYNTKVIFDSLNIDFDPLQWDLNPEGIGVQPMIASVTMNFKFIGGSDLSGPISRLQNAVSFNFFANTGVYDRRSNSAQ